MTVVTTPRTALAGAADAVQALAAEIQGAGANTGVHIRGAFMTAARHVRSGQLSLARETLVAVGHARHAALSASQQALHLLERQFGDTQTAITA